MGRHYTGAQTVGEASQLRISWLVKRGALVKGKNLKGTISWKDGGEISIETKYTETEAWLRVAYSFTPNDGEPINYDYKIFLLVKPSNLGKGEVFYFYCPQTGKRCRVLYRAYGSHIWKHREAYSHRLYYPSQLSSRLNLQNDRYWRHDRQIEQMEKMRATTTYNGKKTRRAERLEKLKEKKNEADRLRWSHEFMPKVLVRMIERGEDVLGITG